MTILSTDIKLLASERMSDASDGGGRRTANVIPDGVAGNVFPKVSRVDSVYGRVNLRKVFGHVATANLDMYAGAHFIITDAPDNARISVTAFSTASDFDTRAAARDRIESYVIAGPVSRMTLYGRQLIGSQAVLAYQRLTEPLPEIGDVYAISNEVGGVTTQQQFFRIGDVTSEARVFTDDKGEFDARVVTIKIGSPLRYEFYGPATPGRYTADGTVTAGRLRSTTVADAARYFGIQPLSAAASTGALELSVASVYAPLVPTTQRETALSLASVVGATDVLAASTSRTADRYFPNVIPAAISTTVIRLERGVTPGSLHIKLTNFGDSSAVVTSGLDGTIPEMNAGGVKVHGAVDHAAGTLTLVHAETAGGSSHITLSYIPAVEVSQPAHTLSVPVTLATRGTVYAIPLLPIPAPGTLLLDYRALGKWYRLRDNGTGELVGGDVQYGTGTVDYINGALTVTLGALPDVGSSLVLSWGSPAHYEIHTADAGSSAFQDFTLASVPVKLDSFTCDYVSNGTTYTVTANSAGVLSGGGVTGTVDAVSGACHLEYGTRLPDFDSTLAVAYSQIAIDPSQPNPPADGTVLSKSVAIASTAGSTVEVGEAVKVGALTGYIAVSGGYSLLVQARADGIVYTLGQSVPHPSGNFIEPGLIAADQPVGTLNAATGTITFSGNLTVYYRYWRAESSDWLTAPTTGVPSTSATGTHNINYNPVVTNGIGGALITIDVPHTLALAVATAARIKVDLTRTSTCSVAPDSVLFTAAGKTFIERSGTLYCDVLPSGSATPAGTIDYSTGIATLALWVRGATLALTVQACLAKLGDWTATSVFFRTAGSPLRPASLYVQVTAADGELLTGTADVNGNIAGADMVGKVEQTMGVAGASFGRMVTAAGNESEPWYDADNVVAGMIFKPREVMPGTLRYSAVVLSNLPLNADQLGLDPTRLPTDGRAPIFRPADVAVIHHTASVDAGTPSAGTIISAGRTALGAMWLEDTARKKLDAALYTVDLAAGTATLATPLDLAGYTTPITARHRIEEMLLLSDVQINGQVTLTAPLLRDYPMGSMLSSALLFGDLQARVTNVFEQSTWTSVWQDTSIGATPAAQYDDVNYPIEVLNDGTVTERWRIQFTSGTAFQVIGQNLGVIATGSISADLQPINALTGLPYFTLRKDGWGLGWSAGNQLRFDTLGATAPIWLARTVLPGATLEGDSFDAQLRGDVD